MITCHHHVVTRASLILFDETTHLNLCDDCSDPAVAARCRRDFQMSSRVEENKKQGLLFRQMILVVEQFMSTIWCND